ncbi:MAG: peroxiredoxin [Chloroflexota bacterium]
MPTIGEQVPDFTLANQDNQTVTLSELRGKKVILFAYPRANTKGCTTQACGFRDLTPKVAAGDDVVVLGISDDPVVKLKAWHEAESFGYDLLSDPDHAVIEAWGAWGEKNMYGKKYMGTIRSHWVIDSDGTLLDEQIKISPQKSVNQALKVIGE